MALTIKQSDLYRFERLVSKLTKPSEPPIVCFIPSNSGTMTLAAFSKDAILTMTVTKQGFVEPFATAFAKLKPFAAKKSGDVTFDIKDNSVHVRCGEEQDWLACDKKVNALPNRPNTTATNDKRILDVLHQTARCVDTNSVKTALTGICLRGATSQILGTSGIQLLVHEHFEFPFKDDVICPVSKIFGAKELLAIDTDEVLVGQVNEMVYFGVGNVEIWLRAIDGKFPKVADLLIPAKDATFLEITVADATFIIDRLDKLPGKKEHEAAIWLSLDEKIQVRAYDISQQSGIALELSHSNFTGTPTIVSMNRTFLKNAMQFGCLRFSIATDNPVICSGNEKSFVFMPLSSKEPEYDATKMAIITSASAMKKVPVVPPATETSAVASAPVKRRRRKSVKQNVTKPTIGKVALLSQAEEVRQALRTTLGQVNDLIREVKAQRSKDKLIQNTMDSLRKLNLNIV